VSVYFVTCRQTGTVKIGSSIDPWSRLKELQTSHPFELTVEAVLPGSQEEEFTFHRRFEDVRLKGEWFTINEMIEAIIAANPAPDNPPDYNDIARKQRKRIALDPREQEYADIIARERLRRPMPTRKMTQWERSELRRHKSKLHRLEAAGDIHFPFRGKGAA
jgi:hypothetical protein